MIDIATIRTMLDYTDWANGRLLEGAAGCTDEQLDRDLAIGPGTLGRILLHTYNGELIWFNRWRGVVENKWPDENERVSIRDLKGRFEANALARDRWLATLSPQDSARMQAYRDSKGSLFQAALGDMLMQGVMHTKHHQAQAVNALKRLGAPWPELDYMYRARKPAPEGAPAQSQHAPRRTFVALYRPPRANFMADSTPAEMQIIGEHFAYLQELKSRGDLLIAGPRLDAGFGIAIFHADSPETAQAAVAADPIVAKNLFTCEVNEMRISVMR